MFPLLLPATPPDFVTTASVWETQYLSAHPDVCRLAVAPAKGCDGVPLVSLALWVREITEADYARVLAQRSALGRLRPTRAPDLELSGDDQPPPTFFDRCPGVEALSVIEDHDPPFWAAKVWLAPSHGFGSPTRLAIDGHA